MPPTLEVIAALLTYRKNLYYSVVKLVDRANYGHSFGQLEIAGLPLIKIETDTLGHGLTIGYTEHVGDYSKRFDPTGLVWINKTSCHPFCSFLGRECIGNLSSLAWLQEIEKKHLNWLDRLPKS